MRESGFRVAVVGAGGVRGREEEDSDLSYNVRLALPTPALPP